MHATRPLFPLGRIVATPGALEALHNARQDARELLARHVRGDWGTLSADDWNTTYDWLTQTHLNTQRGALNTVHEELRPEDDAHVQAIGEALAAKTEQAQGNLGSLAYERLAQSYRREQAQLEQQLSAIEAAAGEPAAGVEQIG